MTDIRRIASTSQAHRAVSLCAATDIRHICGMSPRAATVLQPHCDYAQGSHRSLRLRPPRIGGLKTRPAKEVK
jgi:hypothetical protein